MDAGTVIVAAIGAKVGTTTLGALFGPAKPVVGSSTVVPSATFPSSVTFPEASVMIWQFSFTPPPQFRRELWASRGIAKNASNVSLGVIIILGSGSYAGLAARPADWAEAKGVMGLGNVGSIYVA